MVGCHQGKEDDRSQARTYHPHPMKRGIRVLLGLAFPCGFPSTMCVCFPGGWNVHFHVHVPSHSILVWMCFRRTRPGRCSPRWEGWHRNVVKPFLDRKMTAFGPSMTTVHESDRTAATVASTCPPSNPGNATPSFLHDTLGESRCPSLFFRKGGIDSFPSSMGLRSSLEEGCNCSSLVGVQLLLPGRSGSSFSGCNCSWFPGATARIGGGSAPRFKHWWNHHDHSFHNVLGFVIWIVHPFLHCSNVLRSSVLRCILFYRDSTRRLDEEGSGEMAQQEDPSRIMPLLRRVSSHPRQAFHGARTRWKRKDE